MGIPAAVVNRDQLIDGACLIQNVNAASLSVLSMSNPVQSRSDVLFQQSERPVTTSAPQPTGCSPVSPSTHCSRSTNFREIIHTGSQPTSGTLMSPFSISPWSSAPEHYSTASLEVPVNEFISTINLENGRSMQNNTSDPVVCQMNSNFRDESIEEGFEGNVADHLGNEDDSVSCSQRTAASIEGTPTDQYILLSPIISDSPVSEPNLSMFCDSNVSDYCIRRLFDNSH